MIDKIDYIHTRLLAMTYEWSHRHNGVINIVALILAIAFSVYVFYFAKSKKERWVVLSVALLMNILVLVIGILNKAKFGVGFVEYVIWGPGAIVFMDIAYFFHIRGKMKTWVHVVAFIIFLMSSLILTTSFVLTEIIPANVLINWGTL
jgi:hypothetical protein